VEHLGGEAVEQCTDPLDVGLVAADHHTQLA